MAELEIEFTVVLVPYTDDFITVGQTTEYISLHAPPASTTETATVADEA
jgi:hypothetical protein